MAQNQISMLLSLTATTLVVLPMVGLALLLRFCHVGILPTAIVIAGLCALVSAASIAIAAQAYKGYDPTNE
jgi:hypothetical protein